MKPLSLQHIARLVSGGLPAAGGPPALRVQTDSRRVAAGDLFVALRGERFDAHDYLEEVASKGAAGALVERGRGRACLPCIEVADVLTALQQLAAEHRRLLEGLVIAITGSNGKTSTKDFMAAIMATKLPTRATLGNLNNHIGLPLTLLAQEENEGCLVAEMGMNHAGELRVLTDIARHDAAIITHIGVAHIEHLGSRDAIAWEKATVATQVPAGGVVVLNADDDYSERIARHCQARVLTAGRLGGEIRILEEQQLGAGSRFVLDFAGQRQECQLPLPGAHMVSNAALAAAMGWAQGVAPAAIAEALASVQITGGRMQLRLAGELRFLDDSYNANPDSACAALQTLVGLSGGGRRFAVMGLMGELGAMEQSGHERVGRHAACCGVDTLIAVGQSAALQAMLDAAKHAGLGQCMAFADHAQCAAWLRSELRPQDAVLLKGSRSAAMERIFSLFQTA